MEDETGAPPQLYLRSTVSFVAQGWVTGMRGLQLTELLGWSERQLCQWLQVGGVGGETLTMIQMFNLDGMYLASLGVPGTSGQEQTASLVKYLERNLGIADQTECRRLVQLLTEIQAAEVIAWLEDKARELDGRYPAITAAVQFCASQARKVEVRTRHAQSPQSTPEDLPGASSADVSVAPYPAQAGVEDGRRSHPKPQPEEWGGARRREAAEGRRKQAAAATRVQQVWRGVRDRVALGNLMEALGYFDNGELDNATFYAQWTQEQRERERRAAAAAVAATTAAGVRSRQEAISLANVSGIAGQMLAAASAQEQAATAIAAGYRAHAQRATYLLTLGRRQQAACSVQSAWRGKAVRGHDGMVVALTQRHRALLERAVFRRRLRVLWASFFAWLGQTQQAQAVVQLRERALHGQYQRLLRWALERWGAAAQAQRAATEQVLQARQLEQQVLRQHEADLRTEEEERSNQLAAENQRQQAALERRQGEQRAASLLLRALSSREPELVEQALAAAAQFPNLKPQHEACQKLYQTLVVGMVREAQHSGDLNLVRQALALARKNNLANSTAQLEAWLAKLGEIKTLILKADKSGELAVIGAAVTAAQAYPCFEKQVAALLQMKSLLADVHSLLHQALERQEPADVAMAIKVAARFDAIRSSSEYAQLLALQKQQQQLQAGGGGTSGPKSPRSRNGRTTQVSGGYAEDVPPPRASPRGGNSGGHQVRGVTPTRGARDTTNNYSAGSATVGMMTTPGGSGVSTPSNKPPRAPSGIRSEVAEMIAHCAEWVAQHGPAFERTLRTKNADNPAFNFLQYPQSIEAAYYRKCLDHQRGLALVKMSDTGKRQMRRPPSSSGGGKQQPRAGSTHRGRRPVGSGGGGTPAAQRTGGGGGNGRSSSRASSRGRQARQPRGGGVPTAHHGGQQRQQQRRRREFDRSGLSPVARRVGAAGGKGGGGDKRLVFIWDMDETLIVFQSLVSGSFMNARKMSPQQHALGKQLGLQMMKLILWPLDHAMFFEQIEQVDKHHVDCLSKFDDHAELGRHYNFKRDGFRVLDDGTCAGYGEGGRPPSCDLRKLAYRYRQIVDVCNQRREGTLEPQVLRELQECYAATDRFANGWLTLAKQMLAKVARMYVFHALTFSSSRPPLRLLRAAYIYMRCHQPGCGEHCGFSMSAHPDAGKDYDLPAR